MSYMKDLWIASFEELYEKKLNEGWSGAFAQKYAEDHADDHARDRMANMADNMRQRAKDSR